MWVISPRRSLLFSSCLGGRDGRDWFWDSIVLGFLLSQPGQLKAIMTERGQVSEEEHGLTRTAPCGDGQARDTGNV